jgi:hypothetical protein
VINLPFLFLLLLGIHCSDIFAKVAIASEAVFLNDEEDAARSFGLSGVDGSMSYGSPEKLRKDQKPQDDGVTACPETLFQH